MNLAKDEGHHHPEAAQTLLRNAFVDDVVAGGNTIDFTIHLKEELFQYLARRQFVLRKWAVNDSRAFPTQLGSIQIHGFCDAVKQQSYIFEIATVAHQQFLSLSQRLGWLL